MTVLMFGWEFPPHISGGLGTACYGLTQAMIAQGMNIIFVVPRVFGDELSDNLKLIGASNVEVDKRSETYKKYEKYIRFIEVDSHLMPYISPKEFEEKLQSQVRSESGGVTKFNFTGSYTNSLFNEIAKYNVIAAEIAKKESFDLIHAHDWLTYGAGIAAQEISGKPLVVHIHATEFDRSGVHVNQQVYDIEKEGMHRANKVVAVSNYTADIVNRNYQIPMDKIRTIHNGVIWPKKKGNLINKQSEEKLVTFIGRITGQKGPSYFIEAARKILEKDKEFSFVMAGAGDLMADMVRKVEELNISSHFKFTGFLSGADVQSMFSRSKVFVMPSVSEPFGIAPLEAIRQGVPVIISKQSGVSEVINHAIKVDYWDTDALADAIHGIVKYPKLSHLMKNNAGIEVDNITWEKASHSLGDLYQTLI